MGSKRAKMKCAEAERTSRLSAKIDGAVKNLSVSEKEELDKYIQSRTPSTAEPVRRMFAFIWLEKKGKIKEILKK